MFLLLNNDEKSEINEPHTDDSDHKDVEPFEHDVHNDEKTTESSYDISKKTKRPWWRELILWAACIVIPVVIIFLLNTYVINFVRVFGESMEPALNSGDVLIVSYHRTPKKGDIVVFSYESVEVIKRVIATEGQTVRIDYEIGAVFVDNSILDEPYKYLSESGRLEEHGEETEWIVPEGCIFVMGDNRNHSNDSRDFGPIDTDLIIGVKIARLPFGKAKK